MPDPPTPADDQRLAWERRERPDFWRALARTTRAFVRNPLAAYARVDPAAPRKDPLVYALTTATVAAVLSALLKLAWQLAILDRAPVELPVPFGLEIAGRSWDWLPTTFLSTTGCAIGLLVGLPIFLLAYPLVLALWTGVLHLCLRLTGALRHSSAGIDGTFRIVCYAHTGIYGAVIPVLGDLVTAVWIPLLQVAGAIGVHRAAPLRAVAGVLLPILGALGLALGLGALALFAGG